MRGHGPRRSAGLAEHPRRPHVQLVSLGQRDVAVDRLAYDGVDEGERATGSQELHRGEVVRRLGGRCLVDPGERGGVPRVRLGAQHGHRAGEGARRLRQASQAQDQGAREGLRTNTEDPHRARGGGRDPVVAQSFEQLPEVEGVAAARRPARGAELRRGRAQALVDAPLPPRGSLRAVGSSHHLRVGMLGELLQEMRVGARLTGSSAGDQEQRHALEARGERIAGSAGWARLPSGRRPPRGGADGERPGSPRASRGRARPRTRRLPPPARPPPDRARGRAPPAGRAGEQALALGRRLLGHRPLEQLAHDSVGEVALELAAAGAQRQEVALVGQAARLGQEAGLPDARRALHHDQVAVAGRGPFNGGPEVLELGLARPRTDGRCLHWITPPDGGVVSRR